MRATSYSLLALAAGTEISEINPCGVFSPKECVAFLVARKFPFAATYTNDEFVFRKDIAECPMRYDFRKINPYITIAPPIIGTSLADQTVPSDADYVWTPVSVEITNPAADLHADCLDESKIKLYAAKDSKDCTNPTNEYGGWALNKLSKRHVRLELPQYTPFADAPSENNNPAPTYLYLALSNDCAALATTTYFTYQLKVDTYPEDESAAAEVALGALAISAATLYALL